MRFTGRLTLLALGAALIVMLAGCGAGKVDPVIARADAICQSTVAQIRAQPSSVSGVARASKLLAAEVAQLRTVKVSARKPALFGRFLTAEAQVARRYGALVAAQRQGPTQAVAATSALIAAANAASRLAVRYGISRCGAAGATVGSG